MSLRAKLLTKLIEELNRIPEIEGKEEAPEMEEDPKEASVEVDPQEMKDAMQEEGEEDPTVLADDEEFEEDPFATLKGRMPMKKKKVMIEG
jgi:hypothetical protein